MTEKNWGGRVAGLVLTGAAASLAYTGGVHAQATRASATRQIDIPAQPVSDALIAFSRQTGIDVYADSALTAGKRTTAVRGASTADAALRSLLAGTGLSFRQTGANTISLIAGPPAAVNPGTTTLAPVTVTAAAETATSPVLGYRATRSATGTRTDTPLRDVPQSVQVVPREVLEDQGAVRLADALANVSGAQQSTTAGNRAETFSLRGFTMPGYAIDGVMLNSLSDRPEVFLDLANVERVEVLKGPASVLYGRAEPGGLVNIVTRKPSREFSADASLQTGSRDFWRGEASVSGPLNEAGTLSARLTGAAQTDGGFQTGRPDSERQFVGGVLQWTPSAATTVSLAIDHTEQLVPFDRGLPVTLDNEVSLPRDRYLGETWSKVDSHKTRVALNAEHQANDWLTLRSSLRYDDALTDDTGIDYRGLGNDGRTMSRRYTDRSEDLRNLDFLVEAESRFNTGGIGHRLLTGAQYSESRLHFQSARANIRSIDIYNPVYGAPMPAATPNSNFIDEIKTSSFFVQDQLTLSEQWKLMAGLRYDSYTEAFETRYGGDGNPDTDDSALTGRLGLVYQPTRQVSLYTSYAESFRPQGGKDITGNALAAEEGRQLEAGIKLDLIPDALSATLSVFEITKKNVAVADPDNPDGDYSLLSGEQRSRGVELDVSGQLSRNWNVMASAAYLDATVTKDETFTVGNRLAGIPQWSGSLWTTYRFSEGPLAKLKAGLGLIAVGKRKGDLDNSFSVDGYTRLDASLSYAINSQLELSLIAKNLTNRDYIETPVSRTENYAGAPRSLMAGIKARF